MTDAQTRPVGLWTKRVPADELTTLDGREPLELGRRTALVVVDVTFGFTGAEGLGLDDARAEYSTACGPAAWEAIPHIARLLALFRERKMPVVFTRSSLDDQRFVGRATKGGARGGSQVEASFGDFPEAIAPRADEWVLEKAKASAFLHTPLLTYLVRERVDSVVVCGGLTSVCVRATVADSCSHGFATFVIDEGCFDSSSFAHANNLFDMAAKFADVLSVDNLKARWPSPSQELT